MPGLRGVTRGKGSVQRRLPKKGAERDVPRLLAIASHELRSPLAAIMAHLDNLLDGIYGEVRGEPKKRIRQIRRIAREGSAIAEEILSITGPDGQPRCPDPEAAIREVVNSIPSGARSPAVKIEIRVPRELPSLSVPRVLFQSAVRNLVENAARVSPKGKRIRVEARREKGLLRVEVKDRGKEIDHPWGGEDSPEQGIGLRIVRGIVEGSGGEVFVAARRGGGKIVGFALPQASSPKAIRRSRRRRS